MPQRQREAARDGGRPHRSIATRSLNMQNPIAKPYRRRNRILGGVQLCRGMRAIAKRMGQSRDAVLRYLRGGEEMAKRKLAEKLDPFKDYIDERLRAAAPDVIPTAVPYREILLRGHGAGETA